MRNSNKIIEWSFTVFYFWNYHVAFYLTPHKSHVYQEYWWYHITFKSLRLSLRISGFSTNTIKTCLNSLLKTKVNMWNLVKQVGGDRQSQKTNFILTLQLQATGNHVSLCHYNTHDRGDKNILLTCGKFSF
jgi:hypothetical protein